MKVIVGITGATGAIFGIRILEELKKLKVESHLIISQWARETIALETKYSIESVKNLASVVYNPMDLGAKISSGSYKVNAMIIAPCSMKTLAAVRHGLAGELIPRAADVTLKERRKLILMVRETPLSTIHLENMLALSQLGATIMPPLPSFYHHPKTIDDIVNQTIARALDQLNLNCSLVKRWGE